MGMNNQPPILRKEKVGVLHIPDAEYPTSPLFHPSVRYPEYPFPEFLAEGANQIYEGVRRLFHQMGFELENWGTALWNPLGHIVEPGMNVVIKPNFVLSQHKEGGNIWSIITHPSVLRAIVDYCWIALRGEGKITIADAPQYDCNFDELLNVTKLKELCDFYEQFPGPEVRVLDLRNYWSKKKHFPSMCLPLPGDPQGNIKVNLGEDSSLYDISPENFYGAVYHRHELCNSHSGGRHEYQLSRTIMGADVVISVPKLKVHKKVGVTLNLKGLVGICTNKNLLLHYTLGSPKDCGDQYPERHFSAMEEKLIRLERWMYDSLLAHRSVPLEYLHRAIYWLHGKTLQHLGITVAAEKRLLDAGNWYGNDSAWRMVVDLLKCFYFMDLAGRLHGSLQRRMFSIIDGIIGGENKGPLVPDAKRAGVLLAGKNLLAVDLVATRLMGFDPMKLKIFRKTLEDSRFDFGIHKLDDIEVISTDSLWERCLINNDESFLAFKPYPGWVGHIEIAP